MKRALILAVLLLAPTQALMLDKTSYFKGDTMSISLDNLVAGNSYEIVALSGDDIIFRKDFVAASSSFSYFYPVSFLDPSGEWVIKCNNESAKAVVHNTRDSVYYLVRFISPLSRDYMRTSFFNVTVNITLGGEKVGNATVQSFDEEGRRINLTYVNGIYTFPYRIKAGEKTGVRQIKVLALKDGKGGEGIINITVVPARLELEVSPNLLNSYSVGAKLPLKIKVYYPNDSLCNANVTAFVNGRKISLEKFNTTWRGSYVFMPQDNGLSTLVINASDVYGNEGELSVDLNIGGLFSYYIWSNIYYIIASLVGAAFLAYYLRKRIVAKYDVRSLKQKTKELLEKKKRLQKDYFVNKTINRKTYDREVGKIDEEISHIKNKLRRYRK